jgi:hypothetical protein
LKETSEDLAQKIRSNPTPPNRFETVALKLGKSLKDSVNPQGTVPTSLAGEWHAEWARQPDWMPIFYGSVT